MSETSTTARTRRYERTVALCNVCGTCRSTSTLGGSGEAGPRGETEGASRCMLSRKCATCGTKTAHAYLRTGEHRDSLEARLPGLALQTVLLAEMRALPQVEICDDVTSSVSGVPVLAVVWFPLSGRVQVRFNHAWVGHHQMLDALDWAVSLLEVEDLGEHSWRVAPDPGDDFALYLSRAIG